MRKPFAYKQQTTKLGYHKDCYSVLTVFDLAERLAAAQPNEEISFFIGDITNLSPWEQPSNRHYITKNTRFGCESVIAGQDGGHIKMQNITELIPPERGVNTACAWDYAGFIARYLLPFNAQRVIINASI